MGRVFRPALTLEVRMTLRETLGEHVRACFTGLWVQSHEHEDALADIGRLCHDEQYTLLVWDCGRGLAAARPSRRWEHRSPRCHPCPVCRQRRAEPRCWCCPTSIGS